MGIKAYPQKYKPNVNAYCINVGSTKDEVWLPADHLTIDRALAACDRDHGRQVFGEDDRRLCEATTGQQAIHYEYRFEVPRITPSSGSLQGE